MKTATVVLALNATPLGRTQTQETIQVHEKFAEFAQWQSKQIVSIRESLDKIEKKSSWMIVMQVIEAATALHNAAMLSSNLAQTLGDLTSQVSTVALRWLKVIDAEQTIDLNETIGGTIDDALKGMLGEQTWNGTKDTFKKLNRVVSTASNIVWSVRSMMDSAQSIAEFTAENTGRIGNALKKFGVVGERAYPWMAEKVNAQTAWQRKFQNFNDGIQNLDDAASSLSSVTGEIISIQDEFQQLKEQKDQFKQALENALPGTPTENKPNKDAADATKTASAGKDVTDTDLGRNDDATT
ncbi:MAG: hypothetical protein B0A82_26915 [Alkalinema sp. CACIAM 70d]|nr:MAG: hypothetical protein B0A82_26915 [Alkalinema sp. CACIAM 70d]